MTVCLLLMVQKVGALLIYFVTNPVTKCREAAKKYFFIPITCLFEENDGGLLSVKSTVRRPSSDSHTSRGASPLTVQGTNRHGLRSNHESYSDMLSALPASVASNMSLDSSKYETFEKKYSTCNIILTVLKD